MFIGKSPTTSLRALVTPSPCNKKVAGPSCHTRWVKGRKGEPSGRKHTLRAHTTHNSVNTWGKTSYDEIATLFQQKTKGAVEEKPFPTFMMGIPCIFWDSRRPRSSDLIVLVAFCLKKQSLYLEKCTMNFNEKFSKLIQFASSGGMKYQK